MDVKFTGLIVYVINQIIPLKGATESCCARGELWGSLEGLMTASAPPPHLVGTFTPTPEGRNQERGERSLFTTQPVDAGFGK